LGSIILLLHLIPLNRIVSREVLDCVFEVDLLTAGDGHLNVSRAELPDGQAAEAHGEGYQFESGVDDNEFVRYADTRAKNRAISDLTSAGALAVSEVNQE